MGFIICIILTAVGSRQIAFGMPRDLVAHECQDRASAADRTRRVSFFFPSSFSQVDLPCRTADMHGTAKGKRQFRS